MRGSRASLVVAATVIAGVMGCAAQQPPPPTPPRAAAAAPATRSVAAAPAPAPPRAAPPATAPAGARSYTVRPGDNLWNLSKQFYGDGTKYERILSANPGLNPDNMKPGTQIVIP